MTLTSEQKRDLSRYRLDKAARFLEDARTLHAQGSFGASVNRSYYAMLTAARALLVFRGIDPETHEGVKVTLAREFIKTGLIDRSAGETFRSLQARRLDSDYGDYIEIGTEESEDSLHRAEAFITVAVNLATSLPA